MNDWDRPRSRLSCLLCRARKVKCTARPPEDCDYCIAQQQPCRWPKIDGRKCRAKRVKRGPEAAPTVNAGGIDWTDSVVASQPHVAANQMTTWVPQPVGTEEDVQAFLNSILNGDILQRDEQDCDNRTGPSTRSQVRWWRPHGRTAFVPGLHPILINFRYSPDDRHDRDKSTPPDLIFDPLGRDDTPTSSTILLHLLDVFETRFLQQFPFIDVEVLRRTAKGAKEGSSFLLYAVAALAAAFSTHPSISRPGSQPHESGKPWFERARAMIGSVMIVPVLETVMGFVLCTLCACAAGSSLEMWMMAGNAVRLAMDMGLHLEDPVSTSPFDSRRNSIVFAHVMAIDNITAVGVGRPPTIRSDFLTRSASAGFAREDTLAIHAGKIMRLLNPLIVALNMSGVETSSTTPEVARWRQAAIQAYQDLPPSLQWTKESFHRLYKEGLGSAFLELHLMTVMMISMAATDDSNDKLHLHSATLIVEMAREADKLSPNPILTIPYVTQPLYHAAVVLLRDVESSRTSTIHRAAANGPLQLIRQTVAEITKYFRGSGSILGILDQRLRGDCPLDFASATEDIIVVGDVSADIVPRKYLSSAGVARLLPDTSGRHL